MLAHSRRLARFILLMGDLCLLAGVFVACDRLSDTVREPAYQILGIQRQHVPNPANMYLLLPLLAAVWVLILSSLGFYVWQWWTPGRIALRAGLVGLLFGLTFSMFVLFLQRDSYPRLHILLVVPALTILLPASRWVLMAFPGLTLGLGRRYILIIGTGREAVRFRHLLSSAAYANYEVVGYLEYDGGPSNRRIPTERVLGTIGQLDRALEERVIDEVIFAVPLTDIEEIRGYVAHCEEVGVPTHVIADFLVCEAKPDVVDFHGTTMLSYGMAIHPPELLAIKRMLDVGIAACLMIVLSPLLALLAVLVKVTSRGPVLYCQDRMGENGRLFRIYKFRTMRHDADSKKQDVACLNELDGPVFKTSRDPRITRVGRWLRRHSLDELPQLVNVIRGEMSIVGPRPPLPDEVSQYHRWQRRRLSMKPGITGLWQVSGRTQLPFRDWVKLDLQYIDNWSLGMDFRIMVKTMWVMAAGTGM